jgi:hypothetical protein
MNIAGKMPINKTNITIFPISDFRKKLNQYMDKSLLRYISLSTLIFNNIGWCPEMHACTVFVFKYMIIMFKIHVHETFTTSLFTEDIVLNMKIYVKNTKKSKTKWK